MNVSVKRVVTETCPEANPKYRITYNGNSGDWASLWRWPHLTLGHQWILTTGWGITEVLEEVVTDEEAIAVSIVLLKMVKTA